MSQNKNKTSLVVIESYDKEKNVEWGLSFEGHNPSDVNYFKMLNKDEAFRLQNKLSAKYPPVTFDDPIRCPSDKF